MYPLNRSFLDEIQTDRMQMSDTTMPTLAVAYSLTNVNAIAATAGEDPTSQKAGALITIAPTGGSGSKLRVTIGIKTRDETGSESTTSTTLDGATYTTLADLITAIEAVDPALKAWALHAPHDYSTDSDDFIALAATEIRSDGKPLETLYRDASEVTTAYLRIGIPEVRDSGRMNLLGINGTTTGVTNGTLKVYRDDASASEKVEVLGWALVSAETAYLSHNKLEASVLRGPLLIEASSDDLSAADIKVRTTTAEY